MALHSTTSPRDPAAAGPRRRPAALASLDWAVSEVEARRPRARPGLPDTILVGAIAAWVGLFGTLVVWRHDRFGTFDHDLGIWDQAVWLLARGQSLITVRGLPVFGFHASPALYTFAPLSWLGAGPDVLDVALIATLAAGALAVHRIGRHHLRSDWQALVPALAFLVNYTGQWMAWETFHPEVMAVTPLLLAYLAALRGRWAPYAGWLTLAVLWKEDVALVAMTLGLVLAVRDRRTVGSWLAARAGERRPPGPAGTRRAGIITVAVAACWFVLATRLLIPSLSPGGNFTEALFGDLGSSPTEMIHTAVTDPGIVVEHLRRSNPVDYGARLTGSFGFVALLSPVALLIGLPQVLINTLAVYDFFWTTQVHYAAMPLFATAVATVEGLARARRPALRRGLLGALAVGAAVTSVSWGLSPVSPRFGDGHWPLHPDPARQRTLEAAVARPGPDDAVSASYYLVPHLTHRSRIYTFPNPWRPSNWGVDDENPADPRAVDWLIVDPTALTEREEPVLLAVLRDPDRSWAGAEPAPLAGTLRPDRIAAAVNRDRWQIVMGGDGLLVLRRRRDPER